MRVVHGTCKKCQTVVTYDIGIHTVEKVEDILKGLKYFQCPGHHDEFGSPLNYLDMDWDNIEEAEDVTPESFLEDLKARYAIVMDTSTLQEDYEDISFGFGFMYAKDKTTGTSHTFDFANDPAGKRWYFARGK